MKLEYYRCGYCKAVGHNIRTCAERVDDLSYAKSMVLVCRAKRLWKEQWK